MTRKKKWLIAGLTGIVLLVFVIILALRYAPWHKLMKRPTSGDKAFISNQRGPGSAPFSLSFDFEVDPKEGIPTMSTRGSPTPGIIPPKHLERTPFRS